MTHTSLTQLSSALERRIAEWRATRSETGDYDDDLLEACADLLLKAAHDLRWLSQSIGGCLEDTSSATLKQLPSEALEFIERFHAAEEVEVVFEGFEEIRVLMIEHERWSHEEDALLDQLEEATALLSREDLDEADLEAWLDEHA